MNIPKINISEIFDSAQGEGLLVGYYTRFVRLQGCNIGCYWCDTKYSWNHNKGEKIGVLDCYNKIIENWNPNNWICFTGGEPLEQYKSLIWLIEKLVKNKYTNIILETSGEPIQDIQQIIDISYNNIFLSVSPKLKSALKSRFEIEKFKQIIINWIKYTQTKYKLQFKFVISSTEDLIILDNVFCDFSLLDSNIHWFIQVEESKIGDKELIDLSLKFIENYHFRLTIQQHKFLGLR